MDNQQRADNCLKQYRLLTARETGLEVGRGSYAAVVEVDYKGLRCAGKKIHRVLYEGQVDNLVRRFEEECRLLSKLRHPHIVQFLGIYFEVDTNAPVLVMEFLPTTLTQCLDRYGVMPEEINCSILQDVAIGLRYLHDRHDPIIHRDLSANNVLLTADMRAKISDLGMAKIVDTNPNRLSTMTKTPGIQCYMPPETMVPKPRYSIKVDIFSYGVMMIHALSGQWPFPGEAVQVNPRNPNNPNDLVGVTEFDRRKEYIKQIGNEHPLMTLIQGCLSNSPSHRPTSSEVHQRVSAVVTNHLPAFNNRVEMMDRIKTLGQENKRVIAEMDTIVNEIREEKDAVARENEKISSELKEAQSTICSLRESHSIEMEALQLENADKKADIVHLHAIITAKEKQLENMKKEKQAMEQQHALHLQAIEQQLQAMLESKISELSAKNALISSKSGTIENLKMMLGQALGTASSKSHLNVFSPGVKLTFTEHANVPKAIGFLDQGITVGRDVYIGVTSDRQIFKYSITEDIWSTLPLAPVSHARIGCLNKKVLVVGGRLSYFQVTADIHEFDEASQQWVKSTSIPPMPTARSSATAVSWSSPPALIVCGGCSQLHQPMTVAEVYHSRTSQWHTVTSLPFPRAHMTHRVIHNMLYLVGGFEGKGMTSYKKTVLSILIPQLMETDLKSSPKQWQSLSIPNVANYSSAAASLGGCLLVVGGVKDPSWPPKPKLVVSSVHAYCPSTSSWVLAGKLPQPLFGCTTATLPTGELLVIGSGTSSAAVTVPPPQVQALCSVVVWYDPEPVFCGDIVGYDVRFFHPELLAQNVTRRVGANGTFYVIQEEDGLAMDARQKDLYVQVRVIHKIEGEWSEGISLGCEGPTSPPAVPSVHFVLKGVIYTNNSAVPLSEVGEGENALLCKTDKEECCGTPPNRFGEFYYPGDIKVPIANAQQGFYRNRGEKIIRLNRRDGTTSPLGRYRCEVPDASGLVQNIYITLS